LLSSVCYRQCQCLPHHGALTCHIQTKQPTNQPTNQITIEGCPSAHGPAAIANQWHATNAAVVQISKQRGTYIDIWGLCGAKVCVCRVCMCVCRVVGRVVSLVVSCRVV
jgi:hypothetical protein